MQKLSDIIEVKKYEPDEEWLIMTYMIMSNDILGYIYSKYKSKEIKTKHFSKYFQVIFRWVLTYFSTFEEAPKKNIEKIFITKKKFLSEEISSILSAYLQRLSKEFSTFQETYGEPFILKEVIPKFIKRQEAKSLVQTIEQGLSKDDLSSVENAITSYTKITEEEVDPELGVFTPSVSTAKGFFTDGRDSNMLFKMPGAIGSFMGPLYRGNLIAISGVEKSGKTFLAQELGYYGAFFHKLKVLDINLEMTKEEKEERIFERISCCQLEKTSPLVFPIFDCENNQFGCCEVLKRKVNKKDLLQDPDDKVSFINRRDWQVCTKCRNDYTRANAKKTKRFVPAIWYKQATFFEMNQKRLIKRIKQKEIYGLQNYRVKVFPRFSATFDDIKLFITRYMKVKRFIPDIVILDYPDILAPIDGKIMDRFNIDYTWKSVAGLAHELKCCIIVLDQATKDQRNKRSLTNMSTSESKTKDAHVDLRLTINKTEMEAELGLMRLGMLFRRKGKLSNNEIMILQRIETASVLLDSEYWFNKNLYYPTSKKIIHT